MISFFLSLSNLTAADPTTGNVVAFGADPSGVSDSTTAIQSAYDSEFTSVYFPAGTYKVTGRINVTKDTNSDYTANIVAADNFVDANNFQYTAKNRSAIFNIAADNITFNFKGTINCNQDNLTPTYMNAVVVYYRANSGVTISNVKGLKNHNTVLAVQSSDITLNNIYWGSPPNSGEYRNTTVDLQDVTDTIITGAYCQQGEEALDINGNNTNITFSKVIGVSASQSIVEINSTKNVTGDSISGTGTRVLFAHEYSGYKNENFNIINVKGAADYVNAGIVPNGLVYGSPTSTVVPTASVINNVVQEGSNVIIDFTPGYDSTSFKIERKLDLGAYSVISADTGDIKPVYIDTTYSSGLNTYRIAGINAIGNSDYSNEYSVQI